MHTLIGSSKIIVVPQEITPKGGNGGRGKIGKTLEENSKKRLRKSKWKL